MGGEKGKKNTSKRVNKQIRKHVKIQNKRNVWAAKRGKFVKMQQTSKFENILKHKINRMYGQRKREKYVKMQQTSKFVNMLKYKINGMYGRRKG